MVVNRDGEHPLGAFLPDHILIQFGLDFSRARHPEAGNRIFRVLLLDRRTGSLIGAEGGITLLQAV